jgi:hypothetical protein
MTTEYLDKKWPMGEIPDEVRKAAVAWSDHLFIRDKIKLAQYMMEATESYRNQYAKQQCIELLNWMFAGAAETIPYPGPNMWLRDLANEYKDSEAFYNAFLTEQSKDQ